MIQLRNISKTYRLGENPVHALREVDLDIAQGEFVAIMGASGSGKSTLMHVIGLLDAPDSGQLSIEGRDVTTLSENETAALRNQRMGFVFQQFNLLPRVSALENTRLPRIYSKLDPGRGRCVQLLEQIGLGDRMGHHPNQLSGGQQQRVAIVRALTNHPEIILADEPTGNLDTKSAHEIMELFRGLHAQGFTVIIVTHDPDITSHAQRIITIRDGKIQSDEPNPDFEPAPAVENIPREITPRRSPLLHLWREGIALIRQSLRSLWHNKARTALSALGILIGVMAVIAMIALATGARKAMEEQLARLGSNLLTLRPSSRTSGGVRLAQGEVSRLVLEDASAVAEGVPSVARATPNLSGGVQLQHGSKNWASRAYGVSPEYAPMRDEVPVLGRFITDEDVAQRARVAVIGMTPLHELFGEENPIGKSIRIDRQAFTVIGVSPERGANAWRDRDDSVKIPITTAMYRLFGRRHIYWIEAAVDKPENIEQAQDDIMKLLSKRHRRDPADEPFDIRNMAEIQEALGSTSKTMSFLLGGIAAISLLVGGIGIMNIMLVSVTERTREIGLRKAVGARRKDILIQFLIEALAISLLGGLIGIAAGIGISLGMSRWAGWTVAVTPLSIILSFGFSAMAGIVFGLWPAVQASKLNPIEALRYE